MISSASVVHRRHMHFKIGRDVLKAVVDKAANTVSGKESQPVLKNFLLKVQGGRLRVMSTDQLLGAIADLLLEDEKTRSTLVMAEGAIAAPAQKILDIASSAPAGDICFKVEGLILTILGGYKDVDQNNKPLPEPTFQSKWVIHCMDPAGFPDLPDYDPTQAVTVEREAFLAGLKQISFAAAKNELKKNLMMVHFNNGYMYAADGHRACRREFKAEQPLVDYSIPHDAVDLLVSLLGTSTVSHIDLCKAKSHLLFKVGADIYNSRKLDQNFPDVERLLFAGTDNYKHKLVINKNLFKEVIQRASVTSKEDHQLDISLSKDELGQVVVNFQTKNTVDDCFDERIEGRGITWDGDPFVRRINWEYLLEVLGAVVGDDFVVRMGEDKPRPTMFRVEEGPFVCVILPLRDRKDNLGRDEKLHKRVAAHTDAQRTKELFEEPATATP